MIWRNEKPGFYWKEFSVVKNIIEFISSFILIIGWICTAIGAVIVVFTLLGVILRGNFGLLYWPVGWPILGFGLLFIWGSKMLIKVVDNR